VTAVIDQSARAVDLGPAVGLTCRECAAQFPLTVSYACENCFGPLEVAYDPAAVARVTRAAIEAGPQTMFRWAGLLPVAADPVARVDLGVGQTRLIRADNLARALGMRRIWVKDDSANPTHSFKDRVVAVAASAARGFGIDVLSCASTGNLANAVAAAAARAGLRSVVFVPADLEAGKIVMTAVYGGTLVAVDGCYDDVNRLCAEVAAERPWGFVNVNLRPYYAEGSKTVGFEVAEQLGWRLPEQVVVPVASGSLLTKVDKAFRELSTLGLVEPAPCRMFGAQPSGCAPVAAAYRAGADVVRPVRPETIVRSLAIGNPADGPYALDAVRRTDGAVTDVGDEEVVEGIRLLARTEGVFGETAAGVVVAVTRRLLADGLLDPDAETVLLNTGEGLKTLSAVADRVGPTMRVSPALAEFLAAYEQVADR
jgi:threonine synthase